MKTIADVFEIPESVHAGDFVLRLSEGVSRPGRTLDDYVVTPSLVGCFEQAMVLIRRGRGARFDRDGAGADVVRQMSHRNTACPVSRR